MKQFGRLSPHFLALNFGPQPTPTTLGELCGRIETGKWDMMFPCSFCDNVYTRPEYLGRHNCRRSKMSKAKSRRKRPVEFIFNESEPSNSVIRPDRFSCSVCGKMIHTGEKPFACTFCDSRFKQNSDLKAHIRTHTGEKPYACTVCPARFSQSSALKSHVRIHTGERPYCCNVCSLKFRAKSDLKRHSFTHVRSHFLAHFVVKSLVGRQLLPSTKQVTRRYDTTVWSAPRSSRRCMHVEERMHRSSVLSPYLAQAVETNWSVHAVTCSLATELAGMTDKKMHQNVWICVL
uniref:C2H2-type domain-containing protein n=1 Tax=Timema genevievae TaxID=629358 RepID=A0A7R9K8P3_TIMGE|nr:unnamed protein product [Timema genevievae]